MVSPIGRTKGMTSRSKGNVVLVAAQLDDADGNPTAEYVLLRADEFGRLRTIDAGAVATFLGLTDTPGSYLGQGLLSVRVNAAEDALEFGVGGGHSTMMPQLDDLGATTWGIPGWGFSNIADSLLSADELLYIPIYVAESRTFTQIGIHVVGVDVGEVARLGIYTATFNGSGDLTPNALTLDAGTVSVGTTGQKTIAISETLPEGFHFLAISSGGSPTLAGPENFDAQSAPVTTRREIINANPAPNLSVTVVDGAAALPDPATPPDAQQTAAKTFVFIGE